MDLTDDVVFKRWIVGQLLPVVVEINAKLIVGHPNQQTLAQQVLFVVSLADALAQQIPSEA